MFDKRLGPRSLILALLVCGAACGAPPAATAPPTLAALPPTATLLPPTPAPTLSAPAPTATLLPPTPAPTLSAGAAALAANLDAQFQAWTKTGEFSGAVLVAQNGQVLLSQGYGFADRSKQTPNTPRTKFRLASLTKQFTAMAILILQERGKLNVQDKLCAYLKDCPAAWSAVTLHHLLTHSSGIPDGWSKSATSVDEVIASAKIQMLSSQPGQQYSYSDTGYDLLGQVIEAVSGQTFEAFLQTNIFDPLQMASTGYDHGQPDLAVGYNNQGPTLAALWNPQGLYAADALYSTAEDLYRWEQALSTPKLVSQKSLDAMFAAQQSLGDGSGLYYGYGWMIDPTRPRLIKHDGIIPGFVSEIRRYPDDQTTLIILTNQGDAQPWAMGSALGAQLVAPQTLTGRIYSALAYEPQADRVILFGGSREYPGAWSDTWAYDPRAQQWSQRHPAQSPRGLGQMVYDSAAGQMLMYVFAAVGPNLNPIIDLAPLGETWTYDFKTDTWTNRQAATTPVGLAHARLAYDSKADRVILFGGADLAQATPVSISMSDATWVYDYNANAWTQMHPAASPLGRAAPALTYDAAADRVILFGGNTGSWSNSGLGETVADTWAYDYTTDAWTELKPAAAPRQRADGVMVYDPASQRDLLVGGDTLLPNVPYQADTWAYDFKTNTWTDLHPSPAPAQLAYQGMALIPSTQQMLAFVGGIWSGQPGNTYWLYSLKANAWQTVSLGK